MILAKLNYQKIKYATSKRTANIECGNMKHCDNSVTATRTTCIIVYFVHSLKA